MSVSQMTQYRREHPEYYEAEKLKNNQRFMNAYNTDENFKNRILEHSRLYYADPVKRERKLALKREKYQMQKMAKLQASIQNIVITGE
jgi:hypothetical protein